MEVPQDYQTMIKTSIILLAYRQENFIQAAMESLMNQATAPHQVIIVDDCSPDSTADLIESFISSAGLKWHYIRKKTNGGVIAAVRSALHVVSGDLIIFAAGDDISEPARAVKTAEFFGSHPESFGLVWGASVMDASGRLTGKTVNCPSRLPARLDVYALSIHDMMPGLHACGAASAFRRAVFDDFGLVRDDVYADDRVYAFRAILLGGCTFLPDVMVRWRDHGANLSYISGRARGPHLVKYFDGCVAVIEQHLQDLECWQRKQRNPITPANLHSFMVELQVERSRLRLLSLCHRPGLHIPSVLGAAVNWLRSDGLKARRLVGLAKALAQMLIPYPLQRMLVAFRNRNG
jgi:glycosyltransferase involved in cell wall biosynthesis